MGGVLLWMNHRLSWIFFFCEESFIALFFQMKMIEFKTQKKERNVWFNLGIVEEEKWIFNSKIGGARQC